MPDRKSQFLSIDETAAYLGVHRSTIARMLDDGEIPSIEVRGTRRLDRTDLGAWVEAKKIASLRKSLNRAEAQRPQRRRGRPRKAEVVGEL
jgi:excisionase family DNA binding protein